MLGIFLNDYLLILISYFLVNNFFSLVLIAATLVNSTLRRRKYPFLDWIKNYRQLDQLPPISIIAPAHNEEKSIVSAVKSLLGLHYPNFEVIVVNDGSSDRTVEVMQKAFQMVPEQNGSIVIFRSVVNPTLSLISKKQGGKADALNVGIANSKHAIFCAIDSDSILEPDALRKMAIPFVEHPDRAVASGGTVRVVNGSVIRESQVEKFGLPTNLLALLQVVEYSRTFLFGRSGWNQLGSNLLISGAFGLFSKKAVLAVGGYNPKSVGEDMELILRLHSHFRKLNQPYLVEFNADPVCWTEVPSTIKGLYRQRHRWQRGLADSLISQRHMFLNPRYGRIGLLGMPYQVFVELLGPSIELTGYLAIAAGLYSGYVSGDVALLFVVASLLLNVTVSVFTVLVEKHYFSRGYSIKSLTILVFASLLENFGYRQVQSIWRLIGVIGYLRGNTSWGVMVREGFSEAAPIAMSASHAYLTQSGLDRRVRERQHLKIERPTKEQTQLFEEEL
jgi:cellulose synthase/poly-beta-1,6-N-acetylglucosamine synthase-like glycosyltransferase